MREVHDNPRDSIHLFRQWIPRRGQSIEILALGRNGDAICGRTLANGSGVGSNRVLVRGRLSPSRPVEGEVFTLDVAHRSREGHLWTLEGASREPRFDLRALRLAPLALIDRGTEPGQELELERVVPRVPGFPLSGSAAIDEIAAFHEAGEHDLAELIAGELLARDLRCLEAHALLGRIHSEGPVERRWTERALRHFRVGASIGDLSIGPAFEGHLPWKWLGNRALLACLAGFGRALQRVGDAGSAREVFERLLRLDPEDPMGVSDGLADAAG